MKRAIAQAVVFVVLVAAGAGARLCFRELPNFAPIAAMALFSGYFFRSALWACLVPLAAMGISDFFLGGYEWQMMAIVYGTLTLPVACRGFLRRRLRLEGGTMESRLAALGGLVACSLASSILFFLATNFAWWPWSDLYEHNWRGLLECYAQGLPFFRYTLAGDLFYACVLFGGYALAAQFGVIGHQDEGPARARRILAPATGE